MRRAGRLGAVASGRLVEQGSTFLAMFLLARGGDPSSYVMAAALFTWSTVVLTVADAGAGWSALRHEGPGVTVGLVRQVCASSLGGAGVAVVVLLASPLDAVLVLTAGVMWVLGGWLLLLRAAALRSRGDRRLLASATAGATVLVVLAGAAPLEHVGHLAAVALIARLLVEVLVLAPGTRVGPGRASPCYNVVANQGLNLAASNADYLLIGLILGPAAFSTYVLGFRLTMGLVSVAAHAMTRLTVAELAELAPAARRHQIEQWIPSAFRLGLGAMLASAAAVHAIPAFLGPEWEAAVPVVLLLALAIPWRLLHSLAGSVALVCRHDVALLRLEIARVALSVPALAGAAAVSGVRGVAATTAVLSAAGAFATWRLLARRGEVQLHLPLPMRSGIAASSVVVAAFVAL